MFEKKYFIVVLAAILQIAFSFDCPSGDIEEYFPHETDCGKFYQCSNGVPILQVCPPGLYFDIELNVCDQNADCGNRTTSPSGQTTTPISTSTDSPITTTESPTTPTTPPPTTTTTPPPTTPTTPPPTTPSTPPPTTPTTPPPTTSTTPPPTTPTTPPTTTPTTQPPTTPTTRPPTTSTTPPPTTPTTPPPTTPTTPPPTTTKKPTTQPPRTTTEDHLQCESDDGFYLKPYPPDCTKYISCDNGIAYLMNCPDGLHFDYILHVCILPENARCASN